MKKRLISMIRQGGTNSFAVFLVIFLASCASSYQVAVDSVDDGISFEKFQKAVEGEYAPITLKDTSVSGIIQEIRRDSIIYKARRQPLQAIQLSQVSAISHKDAIKGIGIGAQIGVTIGAIGGMLCPTRSNSDQLARLFAPLAGIAIATMPGAIIGGIIGYKYEYRLQEVLDE